MRRRLHIASLLLLWMITANWLSKHPALLLPPPHGTAAFPISAIALAVLMGLVLFLPGLAFLSFLPLPLSTFERFILAPAVSLPFYALMVFFAAQLGITLTPLAIWGLIITASIVLIWRGKTGAWHLDVFTLTACVLVLLLWGSRFWVVREMLAPAWGDGVQHSIIVQRMLEEGGLFSSWEPYAPAQTFTYHFGFHATAAAFAWLSHQPAHLAVLFIAQALNVAAVLVLAAPVLAFTRGQRWSALVALLVAGFLSRHPAFYANWSRDTQLAGQVILPALLWVFHRWWFDTKRPPRAFLVLAAWLAAGLLLTHYRVALLAALAALAWGGVAFWRWRTTPGEWVARTATLGMAGLVGALSVSPWFWSLRRGSFDEYAAQTFNTLPDERRAQLFQEMRTIWGMVPAYYPTWLVGSGMLAGVFALVRRYHWAWAIAVWCFLSFAASNPFFFGIGGNNFISNFTLMIACYILLALVLAASIAGSLQRLTTSRFEPFLSILLITLALLGSRQQIGIVEPGYQMLTQDDVQAFEWIRAHTPTESLFLINGFLAFNDTVAVGSDGGWWLTYFTKRPILIPPLISTLEHNSPGQRPIDIRHIVLDIQASQGEPAALRAVLCRAGITHIYLGADRGTIGGPGVPLVPEEWLHALPDAHLLFEAGKAQVWEFNRATCPTEENAANPPSAFDTTQPTAIITRAFWLFPLCASARA